jgi:hypothetical protein
VPGATRRGMLRGAAGIGAAGLAAGVLTGAAAVPAVAATKAAKTDDTSSAASHEPMTAHIHDARTGTIDLYFGERHVRFTDHAIAARLSRAAG